MILFELNSNVTYKSTNKTTTQGKLTPDQSEQRDAVKRRRPIRHSLFSQEFRFTRSNETLVKAFYTAIIQTSVIHIKVNVLLLKCVIKKGFSRYNILFYWERLNNIYNAILNLSIYFFYFLMDYTILILIASVMIQNV